MIDAGERSQRSDPASDLTDKDELPMAVYYLGQLSTPIKHKGA
jgi:hypothetical protein